MFKGTKPQESLKQTCLIIGLLLFIEMCNGFTGEKRYDVMKDKSGKVFLEQDQFKVIRSKAVTFSECSVKI